MERVSADDGNRIIKALFCLYPCLCLLLYKYLNIFLSAMYLYHYLTLKQCPTISRVSKVYAYS